MKKILHHRNVIALLIFMVLFQPVHAGERKQVKVAMSAAFVSDQGLEVYSEMFRYLESKLNIKVEFVSGFSYETINQMLDNGMVDMGFICGLPYVLKKDKIKPAIELLLAPVMKDKKYQDKPVYYSYIIVNKQSKYQNFKDLKGSHFVFNDEISNSGYNMPRAYLIDLGETNGFFKKISRSGSHEESIRMVANEEADVSAVDSLVYDYDLRNNPERVNKTRIIKTLGPAGIPPIVISVNTPKSEKDKLKRIFMGMRGDPEGKKILDKAMIDRFVEVEDSNYDAIRLMNKKAIDTGYKVIR